MQRKELEGVSFKIMTIHDRTVYCPRQYAALIEDGDKKAISQAIDRINGQIPSGPLFIVEIDSRLKLVGIACDKHAEASKLVTEALIA